jgi:integrase
LKSDAARRSIPLPPTLAGALLAARQNKTKGLVITDKRSADKAKKSIYTAFGKECAAFSIENNIQYKDMALAAGVNEAHFTKARATDRGHDELRLAVRNYMTTYNAGGQMTTAKNLLPYSSFRREWDLICKKAKLDVHPHLLRHTYITELCASGIDIKKVQYLAGHSTPEMTLKIYAHVIQNRPHELIEAIEGTFPLQALGVNFGVKRRFKIVREPKK